MNLLERLIESLALLLGFWAAGLLFGAVVEWLTR